MTAKQAIRGLVRTLLWPVRRFFDPRFAGVAERVDEVIWLVRADVDAANEATTVLGHSLAEIRDDVREVRDDVRELDRRLAELLETTALMRTGQRVAAEGAHLQGSRAELEAVSRYASRALSLGDETVLCRVLGKFPMYADARDYTVAPHLCLDGYWEPWITLAVARSVKPGWHCVDVGANHGYYTVLMADAAGPTGRVVAVEPQPYVAQLLRKTLSVNGLDERTTVVEKAASAVDDASARLVVSPGLGGDSNVLTAPTLEDEVLQVETVTLDRLTDDWPRVDIVKIDVEGAEETAWDGMRELIARNPNVLIIMEVHFYRERYDDPEGFLAKIVSDGFTLRYIDSDAVVKEITAREILESRSEILALFLQKS